MSFLEKKEGHKEGLSSSESVGKSIKNSMQTAGKGNALLIIKGGDLEESVKISPITSGKTIPYPINLL